MSGYTGKSVWIIGASSGIGHALARELHQRGAKLILSARNEDALKILNSYLDNRHTVISFDVTDTRALANAFENIGNVDSAVYLAADYKPGAIADIIPEDAARAISINLESVFTFLSYLLPHYRKQGYGQVAICGSVAGYKGLPGGQPYSATKAAIINLTESLRAEMAGTDVDVRLISPGFVRTPLTSKNSFSMPMMIEPEEAAREIANGLSGNAFEIHFPKKFTFLMKLLNALPYPIYFGLMRLIKR